MHTGSFVRNIFIGLIFVSSTVGVGFAQTTAFTYQGSLNSGGVVANGNHDFEFVLFDAASGGAQVGPAVTQNGIVVTNGIFAVSLDFGNQFPGAGRFLEIRARIPGGGAFTPLSPRQPITSTPYAVKSLSSDTTTTATNATQLGGVAASQYLQTNGNGSGLTNLNADSITTGTLNNARLGQIPTANIADNAVTAPKIAGGQVVKGLTVAGTTLTDNVTLAQGDNITITPTGNNTLTIASTSGGVGGSGTVNSIPVWNGGTNLGNSQITQNANGVQLGDVNSQQLEFRSTGESGISWLAPFILQRYRADIRSDGFNLKLLLNNNQGSPDPPPDNNGIIITRFGSVGIGTATPVAKLDIVAPGNFSQLLRFSTERPWEFRQVRSGPSTGLELFSTSGQKAFEITASSGHNVATFLGDAAASKVGIGTITPTQTLDVNGTVRIRSFTTAPTTNSLCIDSSGNVELCGGSSLKWKTNVQSYRSGLDVIRRLHPISYNWKEGGAYDIGLGAEDVAKAAPFFAFRNKEGVVEGVKYERLNMVLINAVKEQQEQIATLRAENVVLNSRLRVIERSVRKISRNLHRLSRRR